MEDIDSTFITSKSKPKKPRSDNPCCQVCGNVASTFSCSAFVCEACKKFFIRATKAKKSYMCTRGGGCVVGIGDRARCSACRYKKCTDIGMLPPGQNLIEVTKIHSLKCKICERAASGFHYGTLTCEGCRIFFGRLSKHPRVEDLVCPKAYTCKPCNGFILTCRACRFRRCLENGMSPDAKRVGRQPNSVKHERFLENQTAATPFKQVPGSDSEAAEYFKRVCNDLASAGAIESDLSLSDFACIPELKEVEGKACVAYNTDTLRDESRVSLSASGPSALTILPSCHRDHSTCANNLQLLKNDYKAFQASAYEIENLVQRLDGKLKNEHVLELLLTTLRAMLFSLIRFLKKVPGFSELSMEDRITITKNALFKNGLLLSAYTYDLDTSTHTFFMIKTDSKTSELVLESFPTLSVSKGHFSRSGRLIKQLNLEEEEFALLTALNCFDPAVTSQILDHTSFLSIHDRYMSLLGCYLTGRSSDPLQRFTELQSILRACNESRNEHATVAKQFIMNYMEIYLKEHDELDSLAEIYREIYLTN